MEPLNNNSLNLAPLNSSLDLSSKHLSKRYLTCVQDLRLKIKHLGNDNADLHVISIISCAYNLLIHIDFNYFNLARDYTKVQHNQNIKEFFGDCNKIQYCWDKQKATIMYFDRITFLFNQITQTLKLPTFNCHYDDIQYKEKFIKMYNEVIIALYNNGCRNFRNALFDYLDLSNLTFKDCFFFCVNFYQSNLNGSVFKNCNLSFVKFTTASIDGTVIDNQCKMYGSLFLFKFQISNLLTAEQQINVGVKIKSESIAEIKYILLNQISKEMDNQINNSALNALLGLNVEYIDTDIVKITNTLHEEYILHLVCNITYNNFATFKSNNSKICAVIYSDNTCMNKIWLYDYNSLLEWLKKNDICPLRYPITQIKVYSLEQIFNKIIRIPYEH